MGRKLLIAAAVACAAIAPALAYSQGPSFRAEDTNRWVSSDGDSDLTVTKPATVEFAYPTGNSSHTVTWSGTEKPSCSGVPTGGDFPGGRRGWKGTCTFNDAGTYEFACSFHPEMTGSVTVVAPAATQTPTPSPSPSPEPTATPQPTTNTTIEQTTVAPLSAKLAATQKGTSVRGSVQIAQPASRLEVTVMLGKRRAGRYVKNAAASGTKAFAVTLDAKARKELARKRSLKLKVTVAVTPRGGARVERAFDVRLRG